MTDNFPEIPKNKTELVIRPKLRGFFLIYFLFGLPSFLVSCFLITSVVFGFLFFITSDKTPKLDYNYQTGNSLETKPKILIYELKGQIETGNSSSKREGGIYTEVVKRDFEIIKKDKSISAVLFKLDTPGGSVFASEVLGDLQTGLLESKNQKIGVYYFDGLVASGGLFSSYKNSNYVIGSKYGYTGSIGVIAQLSNFKKLAENVGFSQTTIKAGAKKDYGNGFKEISKEEIGYFQAQIDKVYDRFKNVIETGRKLENAKVSELATGEVWDNEQALKLGLLDEIGSENIALKKIATLQKLTDYNIITIESNPSFVDSITGQYFPILANTNILESNKMYMIKE